MAWEQLSVGDICRAMTDRKRNGGRGPAQLADHLIHDPLVLWAWSPGIDHNGKGRAPPPLSNDDFKGAVSRWISGGMPCP